MANQLQYDNLIADIQKEQFIPQVVHTDKVEHMLPQVQVINDANNRYHINTTLQGFDTVIRHNGININARLEFVDGIDYFKDIAFPTAVTVPVVTEATNRNYIAATPSCGDDGETLPVTAARRNVIVNKSNQSSLPVNNLVSTIRETPPSALTTMRSVSTNGKVMVDVATMTDPLTPEEQERLCQWEGFAALQSGNKVAEYLTSLREFLKISPPSDGRKRSGLGDVKIVTAPDGSRLFCCSECHMAYADKTLLEQHLANHKVERRFICVICGAGLKRKEHLDRHQLSHSDERPYTCSECPKTFKRNEHLSRHYIVHSGEKNQICGECGKAFYRRDHLQKHAQGHIAKRLRFALQSASTSTSSTP